MNFSFRIRREQMIAAVVLGLALSGFAAAAQALASTSAGAAPAVVGTAVITDSVTSGTVTGTDAIVKCATTQIAIGGTEAIAVPAGCLTEYNGEWYKVSWTGTGVSTELTQQRDGNFVLYAGNGKKWGAATRFADNANGPGCFAGFQGDGNLVVRNCDNLAAIWASATSGNSNAILAFQADGNLVIYDSVSAHHVLWSTKTS